MDETEKQPTPADADATGAQDPQGVPVTSLTFLSNITPDFWDF